MKQLTQDDKRLLAQRSVGAAFQAMSGIIGDANLSLEDESEVLFNAVSGFCAQYVTAVTSESGNSDIVKTELFNLIDERLRKFNLSRAH